jgi:serine/threonine protein kinase
LKIVHRDIKPANILLVNGHFKLSDFGFAYQYSDESILKERYIVGSPIYMPLESLVDHRYSTKSDSFAVGVLIYFLISKRFPWKGKDQANLISSKTHKKLKKSVIDHLPPRIKHMILGLL